MFRLFPAALALLLLLSGCSTVAQHTGSEPEEAPAAVSAAPAGQPAPKWGIQSYVNSFQDDSQPKPIFSPEYHLPKIENADGIPSYEAINLFYEGALNDLSASSGSVLAWAMEDAKNAEIMEINFRPYIDEENFEITMETKTRVSILRSHYSNSGGPYPLLYPIGDTFDLTTGQRLNFADLFSVPAEEAAQKVFDLVMEQNEAGSYGGEPLPADFLAAGWSPERFYLTEDSLVMYFPDSELPKPVGTPTFAVPYTALEDLLIKWQ